MWVKRVMLCSPCSRAVFRSLRGVACVRFMGASAAHGYCARAPGHPIFFSRNVCWRPCFFISRVCVRPVHVVPCCLFRCGCCSSVDSGIDPPSVSVQVNLVLSTLQSGFPNVVNTVRLFLFMHGFPLHLPRGAPRALGHPPRAESPPCSRARLAGCPAIPGPPVCRSVRARKKSAVEVGPRTRGRAERAAGRRVPHPSAPSLSSKTFC